MRNLLWGKREKRTIIWLVLTGSHYLASCCGQVWTSYWIYQHWILPRPFWPLLFYEVPLTTVEGFKRNVLYLQKRQSSIALYVRSPAPQGVDRDTNTAHHDKESVTSWVKQVKSSVGWVRQSFHSMLAMIKLQERGIGWSKKSKTIWEMLQQDNGHVYSVGMRNWENLKRASEARTTVTRV